jgi:hypothetical protein
VLHAEGRTDRQKDITKLIVTFRNFANAPTNCKFSCNCHVPHGACVMTFNNPCFLYISYVVKLLKFQSQSTHTIHILLTLYAPWSTGHHMSNTN